MQSISPKVSAGAGAAGVTTPLSIIVIWVLGQAGIAVPIEVAMSVATLLAALASAAAGYLVPHAAVPTVPAVPTPVSTPVQSGG